MRVILKSNRVEHDADQLRRVRQQLEVLRSVGIEWLPRSLALLRPKSIMTAANNAFNSANEPLPAEPDMPRELFDDSPETHPTPATTPDQRKLELTTLASEVAKCMRCSELCSTRTQTVFGVGLIDPVLCCIGEAPGADEDRLGEPFVGPAGQLLNKILAASGFRREEVYICNIIKCRPPGNRQPLPDEAANCREYLEKQLALVRPQYIVAFGGTAATNLLGVTSSLGKLRGQFHDYKGIPVIATYHPAYLLPHRNPGAKKDVWEDMKMLLRKMGRPIPGPAG